MHRILVVEDSEIDRLIAGRLLQKEGAFEVAFAANGRIALEEMKKRSPDVIVSDLQMPELNGLELVETVRRDYPSIPVILMTYRGSEQIAAEALRRGAASYVPKQCLAEKLRETVKRIVTSIEADRGRSRLMRSLEQAACRFRLKSDPELIEPLVIHVQDLLCCQLQQDDVERLRLGLALKHALWIAHHHGNLEIPLDATMTDEAFQTLSRERWNQAPYNARHLCVNVEITDDNALFSVQHEGPLIDVGRLQNVGSDAVTSHAWLCGFVLISSVVNDVRYESGKIEIRHAQSQHA